MELGLLKKLTLFQWKNSFKEEKLWLLNLKAEKKCTITYAFVYNDAGAICIYTLDDEDVARLVAESKEYNDYWGAFLGWKGSSILDEGRYNDDEYRYAEDWEKNKLYLKPSLDFCEETYNVTDWVDCKDVTV